MPMVARPPIPGGPRKNLGQQIGRSARYLMDIGEVWFTGDEAKTPDEAFNSVEITQRKFHARNHVDSS